MKEYDVEKRMRRFKENVEMGIIPPFMIKEMTDLDSSIPSFAREGVKKRAKEEYGEEF